MPPSVLPIPKTFKKTPTVKRSIVPRRNDTLRKTDKIKRFADITKPCPASYKFQIDKEKVLFYKVDEHMDMFIKHW